MNRDAVFKDPREALLLLVDDEGNNLVLLEALLRNRGFERLVTTTRPEEVPEFVRESDPDLILMDLHMPGMDGLQLLQLLREQEPEDSFRPIVVLTADSGQATEIKALELGATDFLPKPLVANTVAMRVTNLLHTRRLHLQLQDRGQMLDSMVRERTRELEQSLQDLRKMQQEMVNRERFAAMGQMASGIAHDFNNAISIVMGHAEAMIMFPQLLEQPDQVMESFKVIHQAGRDATSIVRRLRQFYAPGIAPEVRHLGCSLPECIGDVITMTTPRWRDQARIQASEIEIRAEAEPAVINLDESQVREILTNLIFNAVDAMPAGGVITIRSRVEEPFGVLEVEDTGIGMTEEVRRRCLELFYTTKGEHGTGLGLGVMKGIVEDHRGKIEVASEPGRGSRFTLRLPLVDQRDTEYVGEDLQIKVPRLEILTVDDDPKVGDALAKILRGDGHAVEYASDGKAAYALFLSGHFDLVITDRSMPGFTGDQLASAIRRRAEHVPIVMLTGFGDEMQQVDERPPGVDCVLGKPVDTQKLRGAIARAWSEHELHMQESRDGALPLIRDVATDGFSI